MKMESSRFVPIMCVAWNTCHAPAREQEGLEGADGSVLGGPALVRDVVDEDAGQEKVLVNASHAHKNL